MGVIATWFTGQLIFDGVVTGLVYGLLAMGVVLVHRATRVINFAVGNMGMVGAGAFGLLVVQYGVPFWIAAAVGVFLGTLYGAAVELAVIRRLFGAPRVIVLVATIGIAQLSLVILTAYPDIDVRGARFPVPIGSVREIGDVRVTGPQLTILLVVPVLALVLGWFVTRTTVGKAVTASAENRDRARLLGINPKLVSTLVWSLAGALSTLGLALMAGQSGSAANLENLGPATLASALAAAVVAGMSSFPQALAAGVAVGCLQALVRFNLPSEAGLYDLLVLVAVVVAMYLRSWGGSSETQTFSFAPRANPVPERLRHLWWVRQVDRLGLVVLGLIAVALPLFVTQASRHLLYTTILAFVICGLSLTVLTGWAGQLSLGQMALAGVGALLAAAFQRGITIDLGIGGSRIVRGLEPIPFGPSLVLAAAATAAIAVVIGISALRVRGLFLAVSTFAFSLAASQYLYRRPLLSGGYSGSVPSRRTEVLGMDLTTQRSYYYFVLAVTAVAIIVVGRLRRTGVGRTTVAVRDNPDTAAAYTVVPVRVKLRAFALAGGLAGLGGALLGGNLQAVPFDRFFTVQDSLQLVAMVVIGGLGTVAGPVVGASFLVGLPAFFPGNQIVPLLTSSVGLLVLLLYFPGGMVGIAYGARDALLAWLDQRLQPDGAPAPLRRAAVAARPAHPGHGRPAAAGCALRTSGLQVRFGGIAAVDDVSIEVGPEEIVGLIGTNGAGKSTLMNAIGGFVPSRGRVEVLGRDVSTLHPAARAHQGLGRTFQAATLFPELTVRQTVQVALEVRHRTGLISSALALPASVQNERRTRQEAGEIIDFLGLGRYGDSYVADLSTGTRRIVELAGLVALQAQVLCLDEPTAGLAQRETEAFGPLIQQIRNELHAAVLIIEHDMPLILGVSDRVYCLQLGQVIAAGHPAAIRSDPSVVASYLGTDDRTIQRSGATPRVGGNVQ